MSFGRAYISHSIPFPEAKTGSCCPFPVLNNSHHGYKRLFYSSMANMAGETDPQSFGVGHIEPDNHSDDSTVDDVCRAQSHSHNRPLCCTLSLGAAQANLSFTRVENRTDSPCSPIRTQHSDLQVSQVPGYLSSFSDKVCGTGHVALFFHGFPKVVHLEEHGRKWPKISWLQGRKICAPSGRSESGILLVLARKIGD